MLLARSLSSIESIAMLLFGFLLLSINTGNILSIALSTPHVSHLPCDILRLTCFGQESRQVPRFADGFFNQLFVANSLDYVLQDSGRIQNMDRGPWTTPWTSVHVLYTSQDSLVKCGSKFLPWLSHAVSPRMHLWFHQNVASF